MSSAVPPPAACPLERAARVPRPVCPGCGRCGRGGPAPAPRRAPLRAGVARRGGGGRASPGGLLSAVVRGVWGLTLPLPRLRAGSGGLLTTCCGRGCGCGCSVCGVCAVRVVVRSAASLLSLWCSPLRCFSAVLCSPCACRAPFPAHVPCSAAGYHLFSFVASYLFTVSSTLLPGMHFFPASALVRVSFLFLAGSSFSLAGPSPWDL